jgi:hypothetical protein
VEAEEVHQIRQEQMAAQAEGLQGILALVEQEIRL